MNISRTKQKKEKKFKKKLKKQKKNLINIKKLLQTFKSKGDPCTSLSWKYVLRANQVLLKKQQK